MDSKQQIELVIRLTCQAISDDGETLSDEVIDYSQLGELSDIIATSLDSRWPPLPPPLPSPGTGTIPPLRRAEAMAQHSRKWPACPECRHYSEAAEAGSPCLGCLDADRFDPVNPGQIVEVVDWWAWAEQTHDACAETNVPAWPPVKIRPAAE